MLNNVIWGWISIIKTFSLDPAFLHFLSVKKKTDVKEEKTSETALNKYLTTFRVRMHPKAGQNAQQKSLKFCFYLMSISSNTIGQLSDVVKLDCVFVPGLLVWGAGHILSHFNLDGLLQGFQGQFKNLFKEKYPLARFKSTLKHIQIFLRLIICGWISHNAKSIMESFKATW